MDQRRLADGKDDASGLSPVSVQRGAALAQPESPGMEEMRETAPMEADGSIIAAGQETKKEILD
jgi:hypothetical protein